jgi:hypothetical protein
MDQDISSVRGDIGAETPPTSAETDLNKTSPGIKLPKVAMATKVTSITVKSVRSPTKEPGNRGGGDMLDHIDDDSASSDDQDVKLNGIDSASDNSSDNSSDESTHPQPMDIKTEVSNIKPASPSSCQNAEVKDATDDMSET